MLNNFKNIGDVIRLEDKYKRANTNEINYK